MDRPVSFSVRGVGCSVFRNWRAPSLVNESRFLPANSEKPNTRPRSEAKPRWSSTESAATCGTQCKVKVTGDIFHFAFFTLHSPLGLRIKPALRRTEMSDRLPDHRRLL